MNVARPRSGSHGMWGMGLFTKPLIHVIMLITSCEPPCADVCAEAGAQRHGGREGVPADGVGRAPAHDTGACGHAPRVMARACACGVTAERATGTYLQAHKHAGAEHGQLHPPALSIGVLASDHAARGAGGGGLL